MAKEEDPFLQFVVSARLMLLGASETTTRGGKQEARPEDLQGPSWSWVCSRILECCKAYPSGVTSAILLSDLSQAWWERSRVERVSKGKDNGGGQLNRMALYKKQGQLRTRLPNIVTIDSIYEKKHLSLDAVLEVVIIDTKLLPGTSSYMLALGDAWSSNSIDLYLHRKFYDLVDAPHGMLRKGREIRLTGNHLRTAMVAGLGQSRLLPTEYLVILLDEEQDDDAMLLGAKFCSDTFSCIQLDSIEGGAEYCFYARLDKISPVEVHVQKKHLKQQQLILCDDNGDVLPLVLWDEQTSIASLFSEGSMVALERPFIAQDDHCGIQTASGFCLEYGSATRLYTVPYVHREEQVMVDATQSRNKVRLNHVELCTGNDDNQGSFLSQVMLPRDSQGSVNFCNFPLRLCVTDIGPKTSGISLFGVVTSLTRKSTCHEAVDISWPQIFLLVIQDETGSMSVELNFESGWSVGEICTGHIIFITGLTSCAGTDQRLECKWSERDVGTTLINITQLPALLTSSCLHQIRPLSQLSLNDFCTQVCRIHIGKTDLNQLSMGFSHSRCGCSANKQSDGTFICRFCRCLCDDETVHSFSMVVRLHDAYFKGNGEVCVLCTGQAAATILQASPDDFCSWPQDEQALYLYSLQSEEFIVTIIPMHQCPKESDFLDGQRCSWRIGHALKSES